MSLWKIAWRSMQQRGLASALTIFSMALSVALIVAVMVVYGVVDTSFRNSANGYHMIVGGRTGDFQLVLNTVYHLGRADQPIPWDYYKVLQPDGHFGEIAGVEFAIPYCLGDSYRGVRIVATTRELFERVEYAPGRKYEFASGQNLAPNPPPAPPKPKIVSANDDEEESHDEHAHHVPPEYNQAVVGSLAALRTGLKVGDTFRPTHGYSAEASPEGDHDHDPVTVVGILKPSGTPNDQAIFMNIEGFFLVASHSEAGHFHGDRLPDEFRQVTAVLVKVKDDGDPIGLQAAINGTGSGKVKVVTEYVNAERRAKDPDAANVPEIQAASPRLVVSQLIENMISPLLLIFLALGILVVVVSGIGIIVSIYNSMNERRREIAVMRSLGAGRRAVLSVVMLESLLLALFGGIAGFVLGHLLVGVVSPYVLDHTGIQLGLLEFPTYEFDFEEWGMSRWGVLVVPIESFLLPGLVVLAGLIGFLPAMAAYRTDVSQALTK